MIDINANLSRSGDVKNTMSYIQRVYGFITEVVTARTLLYCLRDSLAADLNDVERGKIIFSGC